MAMPLGTAGTTLDKGALADAKGAVAPTAGVTDALAMEPTSASHLAWSGLTMFGAVEPNRLPKFS